MTIKTGIARQGVDKIGQEFPDPMTIAQVANTLQCNIKTVRAMISNGDLKTYRVGNTGRFIRILKSDFDALWKPFPIYDPNFLRDHG